MSPDQFPDSPARLEIDHLTVSYNDHPVLEDLSLSIAHGDQVAVVGPNGAGKSTFFKALIGLVPVKNGQILIHGLPIGQHKDCVAFVPQREEIDWRFPVTVEDVVMMGRFGKMGWFSRPKNIDRDILNKSLQQMGILDLAHLRINELSGGQQQRVFLARALAQEPHILLMDEPFTGVDASTQESTLDLLSQLRKQNVTVIVSTHDLNMASERFQYIALINRSLIAFGPPSEVLSPQNIKIAFGSHVLFMDGAIVVDQCCPGDDGRSQD